MKEIHYNYIVSDALPSLLFITYCFELIRFDANEKVLAYKKFLDLPS